MPNWGGFQRKRWNGPLQARPNLDKGKKSGAEKMRRGGTIQVCGKGDFRKSCPWFGLGATTREENFWGRKQRGKRSTNKENFKYFSPLQRSRGLTRRPHTETRKRREKKKQK